MVSPVEYFVFKNTSKKLNWSSGYQEVHCECEQTNKTESTCENFDGKKNSVKHPKGHGAVLST